MSFLSIPRGAMMGVLMTIIVVVGSPCEARAQGLYLHWIGVVDNGEGDGVHGPYGNLHITVKDRNGRKVIDDAILNGPSNREFLDGDEEYYSVYIGSSVACIKIWESDPGPFRGHDVLFDACVTGPGIYQSRYAAAADAVSNAQRRGASRWTQRVWGRVAPGIPKIFLEIRR